MFHLIHKQESFKAVKGSLVFSTVKCWKKIITCPSVNKSTERHTHGLYNYCSPKFSPPLQSALPEPASRDVKKAALKLPHVPIFTQSSCPRLQHANHLATIQYQLLLMYMYMYTVLATLMAWAYGLSLAPVGQKLLFHTCAYLHPETIKISHLCTCACMQ